MSEASVAAALHPCVRYEIPIVIHPDIICDPSCWKGFEGLLCIENMDKRKHTGRTVDELDGFFASFPSATFCLDIAHAQQIDSTMGEARQMLRRFGDRLRQIHISEIDAEGHHERLSSATIRASQTIAALIDETVPIIIESMIPVQDVAHEIESVRKALTVPLRTETWEYRDWGELA
jgi:hypothetical protein